MQERNAAVLKGDTIISGIVENRDGGMSMRHAAGVYHSADKAYFFDLFAQPAVKENKRCQVALHSAVLFA